MYVNRRAYKRVRGGARYYLIKTQPFTPIHVAIFVGIAASVCSVNQALEQKSLRISSHSES